MRGLSLNGTRSDSCLWRFHWYSICHWLFSFSEYCETCCDIVISDQEPQQTRQLRTRSQSIVMSPAVTFSSQLPFKRLGHGTRWLLSWFRKLAGGSQWSLRTPGRQHSCFSACPLLFNGEMRSPSSARSLPLNKHPLQSFLSLIF